MKDGEKRAKKTAKTVKKASREKSSPKTAAGKKGAAKKSAAKIPAKGSRGQSDASKERKGPVVIAFTNPAVVSAFKRAVKKYSNALKRLTD